VDSALRVDEETISSLGRLQVGTAKRGTNRRRRMKLDVPTTRDAYPKRLSCLYGLRHCERDRPTASSTESEGTTIVNCLATAMACGELGAIMFTDGSKILREV